MSTPAEPQSVQQPDHEQQISDEVIDLVDQPDSASIRRRLSIGGS
jgi:hypothetical protein